MAGSRLLNVRTNSFFLLGDLVRCHVELSKFMDTDNVRSACAIAELHLNSILFAKASMMCKRCHFFHADRYLSVRRCALVSMRHFNRTKSDEF